MTRTANETFDHHRGAQPLLRPPSRLRACVFLLVNLVGFAVVNAFWLYLATGNWVRFSLASYRRAMTTPLGELLVQPLNVLTHPWMVLVTGLLLALVVLVPLVVAVLYRLLFAGVFVAAVAVVGHAPVLALALAVGCVIAARTPLRSDMPFLAVLVGMAPVAAYAYFFAFAVGGTPATLSLQKWVFYAPFILAGLTAAVGAAVVLLLARLTGFRPGVVWPVLGVLLAAPLGVFYTQVGAEELEYQLLTADLTDGPGVFADVDLETWKRRHGAADLSGAALHERIVEHTRRRRRALREACGAFLTNHPDGRRAAEVRWLRAQGMSIEVRKPALAHGIVKYSAAYCHPPSAAAWEALVARSSAASQAALGRWKLARLALRRGTAEDVDQAFALLEQARPRLREHTAGEGGEAARVFLPPEQLPARCYYRQALLDVEELLWLIDRNALRGPAEETFGEREALRAWLRANPNESTYLGELQRIAATTAEGTRLKDNLLLAVARETGDLVTRAERLLAVEAMGDHPSPQQPFPVDAAIPAKYHLGLIAMRSADARKLRRLWAQSGTDHTLRSAEAYFNEVSEAGDQPWKRLAQRCLALYADGAPPPADGTTRLQSTGRGGWMGVDD
ncbi:MAG: hypothetical protein ACOC8F_01860 [Planctomycetota bacterium]